MLLKMTSSCKLLSLLRRVRLSNLLMAAACGALGGTVDHPAPAYTLASALAKEVGCFLQTTADTHNGHKLPLPDVVCQQPNSSLLALL